MSRRRRPDRRKIREALDMAGLVVLMLVMPLFQVGLAVIFRWINAALAG